MLPEQVEELLALNPQTCPAVDHDQTQRITSDRASVDPGQCFVDPDGVAWSCSLNDLVFLRGVQGQLTGQDHAQHRRVAFAGQQLPFPQGNLTCDRREMDHFAAGNTGEHRNFLKRQHFLNRCQAAGGEPRNLAARLALDDDSLHGR